MLAAGDLVGGAAADALAGAVVERHGAAAGPVAGHAGEGARLGIAGGRGEPVIKKATAANVSRRVWANKCDVSAVSY